MNRRGFFGKFLNALAAAAIIKEMPLPKFKISEPATGPLLKGSGAGFVIGGVITPGCPFPFAVLRVAEDGSGPVWHIPAGTYEMKHG